jgi:exonuclease III
MMDTSKIDIASFTCKNFKSSIGEIRSLCQENDIVLLQETWLSKADLPLLSHVHPDFHAKGISAMDLEKGVLSGRPHDGLAILWRKSLTKFFKSISYDDSRIMGIELGFGGKKMLLVNVYLPYCCAENHEEFSHYLAKLDAIISAACTPFLYIMGDFNADLAQKLHHFGRELVEFCREENIVVSDYELLSGHIYTYLSDAHRCTSWLDHLICTRNAHSLISSMHVRYDIVSSDHLPLCAQINLPPECNKAAPPTEGTPGSYWSVQWDQLAPEQLENYRLNTKKTLASVKFVHDLAWCDNTNCQDPSHLNGINKLYEDIIYALKQAAEGFCDEQSQDFHQLPGWNDYCKDLHSDARESFLFWRASNSPRHGPLYDDMRRKRAQFKYALRKCKQDQDRCVSDSLAKKLLSKDSKTFWKEIKKVNNSKIASVSTSVGGAVGKADICNMWQQHFKGILNSSIDISMKPYVLDSIKDLKGTVNMFTYSDVKDAISDLKSGKSAGMDGLSSEHFKYADDRLYILFSLLFNSMIIHGYVPGHMMDSIIIPLLKDVKGDISDKENYRPIAITCISSKIVELLILQRYRSCLNTTSNQFSFKSQHSTDMCALILKETVQHFVSQSSPVYLCYVDASKAFDRINYWHLYSKLLSRGLPVLIVRLFVYWYSSQTFVIKWCDLYSSPFTSINGLRQGGILSPMYFNVFVDDLSHKLLHTNAGCFRNNVCVNHLFYADDTILMAPSPLALQILIDKCQEFALCNEMVFNPKKTKCMAILPKYLRKLNVPTLFLDCKPISMVVEHKYLGIFITDKFKDDRDIKRQIRATYCRGNVLISKFRKCTAEVKVQLFKTFCSNLYCSPLWCNFSKSTFKRLQVAYNNVFRGLMHISKRSSVSKAFIDHNVDCFNVLIRKNIVSFIKRIQASDNVLVSSYVSSKYFLYGSKLNNMWYLLAY